MSALIAPSSLLAQSVGGSGLDVDATLPEAVELLSQTQDSQLPSLTAKLPPFGANLFRGGFSNDRENGLNPGYVMQPGDRVSVRIWGASQFNEQLVIDQQGNIFITSVGPVMLAGVRNSDLNARVEAAVSRVFSDNVRVYTSLDNAQPVAVFVTGFVPEPGRFAGIPSHSPLYFLDKAGGVDPARGSYRNIQILRDGKPAASLDLYDFLLKGQLPTWQFQDGDTIVVNPLGNTVAVSGSVDNTARFELTGDTLMGIELAALVQLQSDVSFVGVSGIRNGEVFSTYVPVAAFNALALQDGDTVTFRADQQESIIVVDVEGSYRGPSRYAVPENTRLMDLLDYIEIDPELADAESISLSRASIATRQKASLEESLRRLEGRYLTANSQTDRESVIRTQEAQLIGQFVARARQVEPNGRLVVARDDKIANVLLQNGDTIHIPRQNESVLLSGEVLVAQAMLFEKNIRARDYIELSGGFNQQSERNRIVVVHSNGEVTSGKNPTIRAGDEIIVLPRVPVKNLQIAATLVDIIYKIAVAASVAINL